MKNQSRKKSTIGRFQRQVFGAALAIFLMIPMQAHASLIGDDIIIYGYVSDFVVIQEVTVDDGAAEVSCPDGSNLCGPFPLQDGDTIDIQELSIVLNFAWGRTIEPGTDRGGTVTPTALHFADLDLLGMPGFMLGNASLETNAPSVALDDQYLTNTSDLVILTLANEEFGDLTFPDNYQITINLAAVPRADVDFDGDVDGSDFMKWQRGDLSNPPSPSDLVDWQVGFGNAPSPFTATSTTVPEPTAGIMLIIGIAALLIRRHAVV